MQQSKSTDNSPNGLTQKITGEIDWEDYIAFLNHIKVTRQGKGQMKFVGEAVIEKVQREKGGREVSFHR